MAAARSPELSAPATVISRVATHTAISPPGEFIVRAMSAETMKMPEPIIDPTTSMVASSRLRLRLKPASELVSAAAGGASGRAVGGIRLWWVGVGSDREGDGVAG